MRNEFDRFIEKVEKTDSCWNWMAGKYRGGYGQFRRLVDGKWTMAKTHRYSYEYFKGEIPKGYLVCHTCDNPSCVNPDHLFVGTTKDNVRDCIEKGRKKFGRNPKHRLLTKEIAVQIREDHKQGMSYVELQEKYTQSKQQISRVVRGDIWK
jgi:hypothetical protein